MSAKRTGERLQKRQASVPVVMTGGLNSANRTITGNGGVKNTLSKEEDFSLDLAVRPDIPAQLQEFLKEIAFPSHPVDEEEADGKDHHQQRHHYTRMSLKGVKAKVNTGHIKGRSMVSSASSPDAPKSPSSQSWAGVETVENTVDSIVSSDSAGQQPRQRVAAKFSEYEMALLWSQCKNTFADGKVNALQLAQMFRQVLPKVDSTNLESVVSKIMNIFDPGESGVIAIRDLLIVFSFTMKGEQKEKLRWSFRLYDIEDNGKVDNDDMIKTLVRLCELSKRARYLTAKGFDRRLGTGDRAASADKIKSNQDAPSKRQQQLQHQQHHSQYQQQALKMAGLEDEMGKVKILSNKMSERVGATRQLRKKQQQQQQQQQQDDDDGKLDSCRSNVEDPLKLDEEERKRIVEVVRYLDANKDGFVGKDEFVNGCLDDDEFFGIASGFQGELIWGGLFQPN